MQCTKSKINNNFPLSAVSILSASSVVQTIGGNAVFRARTIKEMYMGGTHYDDLLICNSQGVYKNGISKLQQQVKSVEEKSNEKINEVKAITFYPNPANSKVKIQYYLDENETANLIMYDVIGNLVNERPLPHYSDKFLIDLTHLSSGVYFYHFISSLGRKYFGKLIIN